MSDDRQSEMFEQMVQKQAKAVKNFIDRAKTFGINLSPEELKNMSDHYKDRKLNQMLEEVLGMANPKEIMSWLEATKRLCNGSRETKPPEPTTHSDTKQKKKRTRRTRKQMEAMRNAQKIVSNANSM